ncbi:hypothetical protein Barb4_04834 [Bacteroidales bacterium Barb4]|nr:hypothetical protein Barb4_04834 [Bacteroidales bacterium Barb4]
MCLKTSWLAMAASSGRYMRLHHAENDAHRRSFLLVR